MVFDGYGFPVRPFDYSNKCYSASYVEKPQLEDGDKIIMPQSALAHLAWLQSNSPMLFELQNGAANRISHCGVLEFTAEKGMIYMPYWMMENRLLSEGDRVRVKPAMLPKGTYVKLQPHTKDFLDISNPKAILEAKLGNFSCLTTGDSIMVAYDNKKYYIDVVETRPSNAISIIETDCEVDFAPPLDYKEPEKPAVSSPSKPPAKVEEAAAETVLKFNPFIGTGRRLDGKPVIHKPTAVAPSSKDKHPAAAESSKQSASASTLHGITRKQEKLIFDSKGNLITKGSSKEPERESKQEEPKKEEPPKFRVHWEEVFTDGLINCQCPDDISCTSWFKFPTLKRRVHTF